MINKMLKICLFIIFILMPILCASYPIMNPHIKKIITVNEFKKDVEYMNEIAQEWNDFSYAYMYIDKKKYGTGIIEVGYKPNDNIRNDINNNFEYLLERKKYQYIMKSDNAIYFTKYSSLGNGYGVAFSIDGSKPQNEFIISSEQIGDFDGWYFYIMR